MKKKQFESVPQDFDKEKFKKIAAKHGIQIEYDSSEQGFRFGNSGKLYPLDEGMSLLKDIFL